jgi:hypothetical protein
LSLSIEKTAFKVCLQMQLAPLHYGFVEAPVAGANDTAAAAAVAEWGVPMVFVPLGSNALERPADAEELWGLVQGEGLPWLSDGGQRGGVVGEGGDGKEATGGEGEDDGKGGMMSLDAMRGGALCFVTGTQGFCAAGVWGWLLVAGCNQINART